ncbi:MAG: hypothetical protein KJ906_01155 [Nanoarchaeota archaeon]|nr:hypothetical protein [Nanoarchaeota archaeon]
MPVLSIQLKEIVANKKSDAGGNVEINNKVGESDVKERNMPNLGQKGLAIEFRYLTEYKKEEEIVAEIKMTGEVLYIGEDCKLILDTWKKDGVLPEDQHVQIVNTIFRRCAIKALVLAEDLQLPPPIGLPFAKKNE